MEFTYLAYKQLVEKSISAGYTICDYHDYNKYSNPCILRHDVDFDLKKAVLFGELENAMGVKSTFFVLVNTNFYNILSTENRKCMERILNQGHEIGLHFDELQYDIGENYDVLVCKLQEEAGILEKVIEVPVTTVSMHRPSKGLIDANIKIPGMVNSYSSLFFKEFKYFSDSRMFWREDVLGGVDKDRNSALHILTHPFWYDEQEQRMKMILGKFIREAQSERYDWLDNNFRELNAVITRSEIMER